MKDLLSYLDKQLISYREIEGGVVIDNQSYQLVKSNIDNRLFDEKFNLIAKETDCNRFVFNFGTKWYWIETKDQNNISILNPFKYIGKAKQEIETYNFLGVRGTYELLNGSRLYKDWCKKAKFLGIKTLGICEKNTLAGTLKFQLECKSNEIKSILGATYTVWRESEDYRYDIKLYVKNAKGWTNLLLINKEVLVTNSKFIKESDLFDKLDGLFIVFDPKSIEFNKLFPWDLAKEDHYYQLDTVEFKDNQRDKWYLDNLKQFYKSKMKPVAITDAFYLDKEDSYIKQKLNSIGGFHEYVSDNQYFKGKEDYFYELQELFGENDFDNLVDTYDQAMQNESWIASNCNFLIETGKKFLPKYKMTKEEKKKFKTTEDLFWFLIEEGFSKKTPEGKDDEYLARIEKEVEVINLVKGYDGATGIDYFLILWDVVRFCRGNKILVGHGRGSAAGALTAYFLEITQVDPIEWGLFFERFLNPGRATKSYPDIDIDVQPSKKEAVKMYIRGKYGYDQFCYIGTHQTLQLKAAISDFTKNDIGYDYGEIKTVTKKLDFEGQQGTVLDVFKNASHKSLVRSFVDKYSNTINDLNLVLGAPKSISIHACATLILPDEKPIYKWIPVRLINREEGGSILVSEWSGEELEKAGYLKEDILVIDQLDKYADIIETVKEESGEKLDIYSVPDNDSKCLNYFQKAYTADIFQFGTPSFKNYLKQLKPDNIDELIDAVALIRPGAMEVNSHNEYVLRKFGDREIVYKFGTESITKNTKGLIITQEQVMKLCQVLGGFTLAEADDVRKAIGKKQQDLMQKQKIKFINGAILNGCPNNEAEDIWHDIEVHGAYSFNLSHSVAYTKVSNVGMNWKVYYPLAFWKASFNHIKQMKASQDKKNVFIAEYISEINKTGQIMILPPDINISQDDILTDFKTNKVYWSLSNVNGLGEIANGQIKEDKAKNGNYFSLEEFIDRHTFKGSKVNKTHYENLIMAGAFDKIEHIKVNKDRLKLIELFRTTKEVKIKPTDNDIIRDNKEKLNYNWWWNLQQKKLSGLAFFDYPTLYNNYFEDQKKYKYTDFIKFNEEKSGINRLKACIAGYVVDVDVRNLPKGDFARITLENNYDFYNVTVWAEQYDYFQDILLEAKGNLMLINGNVVTYKNNNGLQTNDDSTIIILS